MADLRNAGGGQKAAGQYRFDQWTTGNGLPHNATQTMRQTRDSYLRLATMDGLVRFDGVRFKVYNRSNTPAMASNDFPCMLFTKTSREICGWEPRTAA